MDLKGRNFLTLKDFTPEEITYLLDLSAELKEKKKKGIPVDKYRGMNVALIFEKTSTRTRCSFEVAAHDMGMGTTYLDPSGSQIGKKESIEDTARVLGRMFDGIEYRGFGQEIVEELAKYAGVPVWNGLTNAQMKIILIFLFFLPITVPLWIFCYNQTTSVRKVILIIIHINMPIIIPKSPFLILS